MAKVHIGWIGLISFILLNYLWGTLVRKSAQLWLDLTSTMSTERLYSFRREVSIFSHCLMSILLMALVFNRDFTVRALVTQWYTQWKSEFTCNTVACYFSARLIPLSMASSSATLIGWVVFIGHSQHVSSLVLLPRLTGYRIFRDLVGRSCNRKAFLVHDLPTTSRLWPKLSIC